jgi:hypothetical protein
MNPFELLAQMALAAQRTQQQNGLPPPFVPPNAWAMQANWNALEQLRKQQADVRQTQLAATAASAGLPFKF